MDKVAIGGNEEEIHNDVDSANCALLQYNLNSLHLFFRGSGACNVIDDNCLLAAFRPFRDFDVGFGDPECLYEISGLGFYTCMQWMSTSAMTSRTALLASPSFACAATHTSI